ncbi:MAG: uroporphyrinogen decarboxylase family protein, partial [Bacteroidetes bacterium]|nr:uroporphyrinogen decarboxylase family protein [Bacteroidota bacterium]
LTMHGAKELGLSIRDYFSRPEHIIEGQLRLGQKYQNDCIYTFFYAAIETEAFGGEVIWADDGPPGSGEPIISNIEHICQLKAPDVRSCKALQKVFKATEKLNREVENKIPIIGVVMSPFSLPVMQLGFDKYLEIMHFRPDLFNRLMDINREFCINYANMQLEAGATAICYFDPVSSTTIIPRETYLKTGFLIARQTIAMINGPTATHFASGRILDIVDDIANTGTVVVGISSQEDIGTMKAACKDKLSVLGNMNGIEMCTWDKTKTVCIVKDLIRKAAPGGGFMLSDNHGEIPFQVSDETLLTISETVQTYGHYPIQLQEG